MDHLEWEQEAPSEPMQERSELLREYDAEIRAKRGDINAHRQLIEQFKLHLAYLHACREHARLRLVRKDILRQIQRQEELIAWHEKKDEKDDAAIANLIADRGYQENIEEYFSAGRGYTTY